MEGNTEHSLGTCQYMYYKSNNTSIQKGTIEYKQIACVRRVKKGKVTCPWCMSEKSNRAWSETIKKQHSAVQICQHGDRPTRYDYVETLWIAMEDDDGRKKKDPGRVKVSGECS